MKLLFLLLLCVLILARSARSPRSFDVRLQGASCIPIASFDECGLFIKTFCHRKYLNRRIVYSSGHQGTFNPAVITNKEVHIVHGKINTNDETSHTTWGFQLPKKHCGKQIRAFQSKWFSEFPWLHYNEQSDSVLCFICMQQNAKSNLRATRTKEVFTYFQTLRPRKRGFLNLDRETGFSLPHRYHFDGRSSSESEEPRFRLLEIETNAVICIHPIFFFFNWEWHLARGTQAGHVRDRN